MQGDDNSPAGAPAWEPLGLLDLFRLGPWEIIALLWVLGGVAIYSIAARPLLRMLSVTDPALAGVLGGMLAVFIAAQAARRRYASPRSLQFNLYVLGSMALGALALGLCAHGPFHTVAAQASSCAPRITLSESKAGYWASWLLLVLLWLFWCGYLFSGFPAARRFSQFAPHSRDSRYRQYDRGLRILPFRAILLLIVAGAIWTRAYLKYETVSLESPVEKIVAALAGLPATAFQTGEPEALLGRIEEVRLRTEGEALKALDTMELDRARPLVKRAACELLLPTSRPTKEIISAEMDFSTLDRELNAVPATENWPPSSSAVAAILRLTPINIPNSSRPICPFFWPSTNRAGARHVSQREIRTSIVPIAYRNRQLLSIRLTVIPLENAQPATLEVAIKVSGTTGETGELAALLESRLGQKPTEGPQTIGRGSICAHWILGSVGIRLGPAVGPQIPESAMTPKSPLWITCYDRSLNGALDSIYQASDGRPSWDPHSCGYIQKISLLPVKEEPGANPF